MKFSLLPYGFVICIVFLLGGCKGERATLDAFHFTQVPSAESGIHFNNKITESDSVNVYENEYMYNGSGVGIGDFNTAGLNGYFLHRQHGQQQALSEQGQLYI
jgi:hypothetical protein